MVDPTLTASFAAISLSDLAPLTQRTWDPRLARDPRLLVPVDVRAIAVADGETCEHALAGSSLLSTTAPETRTPPPFSDGNPRLRASTCTGRCPTGSRRAAPQRCGRRASVAARPLESSPGSRAASRVGCAHGWWRPNAVVAPTGDLARRDTRQPCAHSHHGLRRSPCRSGRGSRLGSVVGQRRRPFRDLRRPRRRRRPCSKFLLSCRGVVLRCRPRPLHLGPSEATFDELMTRLGWQLDRARLEAVRAEMARRQAAAAAVGLASQPLIASSLAGRWIPHPPRRSPTHGLAARPAPGNLGRFACRSRRYRRNCSRPGESHCQELTVVSATVAVSRCDTWDSA